MNANHALWPTAGLLAASLSIAAAQNDRQPAPTPPPARVDAPRGDSPSTMAAPLFDRVSRVRGYDVKNSANETVGSVQDLIIDRGSGRVEYALVKSGGLLGMGGKTIAVPYSRLSSPVVNDRRFMIDMTKQQAEQAAAFVPENWAELRRDAWADRMHSQVTSAEKNDADTDPTATAIAAAMEEALGGEVVAVKRDWSGQDETVIVELKTKEGTVRDLQMGPSWWVMSQPGAPMRGDKFEGKVRVVTKDGANPRYIVSNATVDGKTLVLRDSQFQPAWNVTDGVKPDDATKRPSTRAVPSRLVLASEIVGAHAVALDKESADVEDAVIDVNSGTIVALCVDPNDSTLGWGDTKRLVPWSATTFATDGKVYIDANQQMLTAAPEVPKDLNAQPTWSTSVYSTFGVPPPRYDRSGGGWDAKRREQKK